MWTLFCDVCYVGTSFYRGKSATFCFALLYPYVLPGFQMSSGFQTWPAVKFTTGCNSDLSKC